MSLANAVAALLFAALSAYALLGGADFGVGFWDLVAGGAERGAKPRSFIERVMAPVWEANHVWLIFALVVLWTCFPEIFASVMSTLWIPMSLAVVGIMLRGAAYAWRKEMETLEEKRNYGIAFAVSSVVTPFFLGTVAGAIASGRVPLGNAEGDPWSSWLNPTSLVGGILAVAVCAFLGAVYLARDAHAFGEEGLADYFRVRGLGAGIATGAIAVGGAIVLAFDDGSALVEDAPTIFEGLTGRALPLMILSAVGGLGALGLLWKQRYGPARLAAAGAVLVVIWGWAVGQYPYMLEGVITIEEAAGAESTLISTLVVAAIGLVVLAPSLAWLFVLMQRGTFMEQGDDPAWTAGRHRDGSPGSGPETLPPGPPDGKAG